MNNKFVFIIYLILLYFRISFLQSATAIEINFLRVSSLYSFLFFFISGFLCVVVLYRRKNQIDYQVILKILLFFLYFLLTRSWKQCIIVSFNFINHFYLFCFIIPWLNASTLSYLNSKQYNPLSLCIEIFFSLITLTFFFLFFIYFF